MRSFILILFFTLFSCCLSIEASVDVGSALSRLDSVLAERQTFEDEKMARLQELTLQLQRSDLSLTRRYDLVMQLQQGYAVYKFDSAYHYARLGIDLAQRIHDRNRLADAQIALMHSYCSAGLFKEAFECISQVDTTNVTIDTRASVLTALCGLTYQLTVFSRKKEPAYSHYLDELEGYIEELRTFLPPDDNRIIHYLLDLYTGRGQHELAMSMELARFAEPSKDLHDYAIKSVCLGRRYLALGDTLNGIHYICEAAIADVQNCTRETTATRLLAEILYALGNIEQAYKYAREALDDAEFFDSRHREIEIANILPIIENQRFDIIKHQKNQLLFSFIVVSLLFLAFLIAVVIIMKQVTRIKAAREIIEEQNGELVLFNRQLSEMNKIKDECIGQIFSISSVYLDKIDEFRKIVLRKIQARQYEDLLPMLKKNDLIKEREDMFLSFDTTFLKLFPDFVQRFNALFREEDRIVLKSPGVLTTELRIFALIRLGITENERIAKFLNYSVNTINTYKTRVKNRSIVPNDQFEWSILEIESVREENSPIL